MAKASGRLIAVLSTEGSGSTLLAAILGGSSQVVAPPELHMFRYVEFDRWVEAKPVAMASLTWLLEKLGQSAAPEDALRRFSGRSTADVYRELLELCGPSRVLVDKTPAYARDTQVLRRLEEFRPHYVWAVRHPLGVLSSGIERRENRRAMRRARARTPLGRLGIALRPTWDKLRFLPHGHAANRLAYWRDLNARLERWAAEVGSERLHRLSYEKLVRAPEPEVRRLCGALGLEFCPAMLEPGKNVPRSLTRGIGNEKAALHDSIDASGAVRWRETLDESVLDDETREMMRRLEVPSS